MRKYFNTEGICYPDEHYMVNIADRLEEIMKYIAARKYFVINRARQYGKTTTLSLLAKKLKGDYIVFPLSFEGIGDSAYIDEYSFCRMIYRLFYDAIYYGEAGQIPDSIRDHCKAMSLETVKTDFSDLSEFISTLSSALTKPVIIIIDEVDQASNHDVFLAFLGLLRAKYLKRRSRPTFHSCILAGVYDIKNLKSRIREDADQQYNSPWNVAAKFEVDMSFSAKDIEQMLTDYEADCNTGMNTSEIATMIYDYTSGYPFLVSRICKVVDEELHNWTPNGIREAIKRLLAESNTLFDDMRKKISDFPELRQMLYAILFTGKSFPFNLDNFCINIASMFGFIKEENGMVVIANRIFETRLYNLFMSEEMLDSATYRKALLDKNQFVVNGSLDVDLILQKFMEHFQEVYDDNTDKFVEENGRRLFLLYLKPIINGTGNYYIESRTRDLRRTDVIIDYLGKQYVIEIKIWHGKEYNARGEAQLFGYLEDYHLDKGYMLSFNFNKKKHVGMQEIHYQGKTIVEVVV